MTAPPPARGWTFFKNYRAGIMVLAHPPLAIHACLGYTKQNGQRIETPSLRQLHARVSSKEQEKEGFSIPAQLKLLKEYAAAQGFAVANEYVDVETAKQTGRAACAENRQTRQYSPARALRQPPHSRHPDD